MYLAENLSFLRTYFKLTQGDVAQNVGIGRTTLTGYEKGDYSPTVDVAMALAKLYRVSVEALLFRPIYNMTPKQLDKFLNTPDPNLSGQQLQVREVVTTIGPDSIENIELVPLKAAMGYCNGGYQDEEFIGSLSTFRLPLPQISRNRKYRLFPTTGESMLPIPSGAFVLGEYVDDFYSIKDGTGCIVVSPDGIVVKKIKNELTTNDQLILYSLNPAFTPFALNSASILEIWKFKLYMSFDFPDGEPSLSTLLGEIRNIQKLVANN
ncbi:helix-turn-helix domain-containing protein [Larkinella humicola]|uniref:Helix-turn-helix domain-containing protein n=1 Tax=Larkinella humicola TaxID=2607654 RepID=A0A5N1J521_9BACT|nr:helix-turn-helix domain-containing protein [Larkinella humicola]KAA9341165.1 helix-turn-helix domain-containing protein [Larkinella humicola]